MAMGAKAWSRLWAPWGAERLRWVFILYCWAVLFLALRSYLPVSAASLVSDGAWALHLLIINTALIAAFGPRLLLLVLATLLAARCMMSVYQPGAVLLASPAAAWTLLFALPLGCGVARALMSAVSKPTATDEAGAQVCRWLATVAWAWAGVHKLNRDFFDATVSCAGLAERLGAWWSAPLEVYSWVAPWMVVVFELSVPALLWLKPRLGVLVTLLVTLFFGSVGATALATMMAGLAFAFLPPADIRSFVAGLRQQWAWIGAVIGCAAGASFLSYRGPWTWPQYATFHGLYAGLLVTHLAVIAAPRTAVVQVRIPKTVRVWTIVLGVILGLNGATPYLGMKFEYSFAMLSNLRVDRERWNSYIFPSLLGGNDPYVRVHRVRRLRLSGAQILGRNERIQRGLFTPEELERRLRAAGARGWVLRALVEYRGQRHDFTQTTMRAMLNYLESLPRAPLQRPRLTLARPQLCIY